MATAASRHPSKRQPPGSILSGHSSTASTSVGPTPRSPAKARMGACPDPSVSAVRYKNQRSTGRRFRFWILLLFPSASSASSPVQFVFASAGINRSLPLQHFRRRAKLLGLLIAGRAAVGVQSHLRFEISRALLRPAPLPSLAADSDQYWRRPTGRRPRGPGAVQADLVVDQLFDLAKVGGDVEVEVRASLAISARPGSSSTRHRTGDLRPHVGQFLAGHV